MFAYHDNHEILYHDMAYITIIVASLSDTTPVLPPGGICMCIPARGVRIFSVYAFTSL